MVHCVKAWCSLDLKYANALYSAQRWWQFHHCNILNPSKNSPVLSLMLLERGTDIFYYESLLSWVPFYFLLLLCATSSGKKIWSCWLSPWYGKYFLFLGFGSLCSLRFLFLVNRNRTWVTTRFQRISKEKSVTFLFGILSLFYVVILLHLSFAVFNNIYKLSVLPFLFR